jgi:hypothetical protein
MMGLLAPEQKVLAGYALTAYKQTSEHGAFEDAWQFARIASSKWLTSLGHRCERDRAATRQVLCLQSADAAVYPKES